MSVSEVLCTVCGWRCVYAKARCRSCYVFERRHGEDKSEGYLVAEGERELDRRFLANHTLGIYAPA